ncbi:hypothetical protein GCM10025868_27530 [Angustibacter aerolatus]|uniref:Uncharacterized protein n=1 Tax=Angustibacter aerolatus TaxID=1162965 RepID=A0ABQ6JH30_9ACTN|nr:hypothetical protein [Angustibacter aerolatus]GMA87503.1 hypothetical protein GCM10025868_27530 [Angustibacter aerolatus]
MFPNATGGWRDRNNVCRDLRRIRTGTAYEWFVSHTARRTVATLLDGSGLTARVIADQAGARPGVDDAGRLPRPAAARDRRSALAR